MLHIGKLIDNTDPAMVTVQLPTGSVVKVGRKRCIPPNNWKRPKLAASKGVATTEQPPKPKAKRRKAKVALQSSGWNEAASAVNANKGN